MSSKSLAALSAAAMLMHSAAGVSIAQENSAEKAVEAAKQYAGTTITIAEEAGLMALLNQSIAGPEWEKLTGIKINVVELPGDDWFQKLMLEHRAKSGAYDILTITSAWVPDLTRAEAIEPLEPYLEKYNVAGEFDDIVPAFAGWSKVGGKEMGLVVDGDVHLLYYRKDIFENPEMQAAFKEKYGYDLKVPATWKEFGDACTFITEKMGPEVYGAGLIHAGINSSYTFFERFRDHGGKFFDPETMKAQINNETGVAALTEIIDQNKCQPPGVETWGFGESLSGLLSGDIAMTISWPPIARWAEGLSEGEAALSWVPATEVKGKIGYAPTPGPGTEMAGGVLLSLSTNSKNKDAAYLYMQWLASKQESMKNVMRPIGLRDPYRAEHFESPEFQKLWATAPDYLNALKAAAEKGYSDLIVINAAQYATELARGVNAALGGQDPKVALDSVATEWDALTERVGVDRQREAYSDWAAKPGAYRN
jgi:multiple sugar transport system substrate-binding protein